ncbi:MAG: ACP S-malonyltransferase [Anaerolineales bacterium]|nr:ACP S-malonyltransferase [Anaerolineales bacterium]
MKINPAATAFLFPGQGSQFVGMGRELAEAVPVARSTFEQADDLLGYPLSELCWNGPEEQLNQTEHTQPALLTHAVAALRSAKEQFPELTMASTAGHSLGQFSALVAAGALSFSDALFAVRERALAMKAAGEAQPGGMVAVLGLELEAVETVCAGASQQAEGGVWVANDNCPGQVVISGDEAALELAAERLHEAGARKVVRLAVSIAAHSPLMQVAQARLNEALNSVTIRGPEVHVIGNVGAAPLPTRAAIIEDLQSQLTSRVRWTESIKLMLASGIDTFIEIGSGSVLTGLLKRIDRSATRITIDTPETWDRI